MDRVDRAKERLAQFISDAEVARDAGPPCSTCRYKTLLATCSNPALSVQKFEAASGTLTIEHPATVEEARSLDGLCGPEALLWEEMAVPQALWREATAWMDRHPLISLFGILGTASVVIDALF